MPSFQIILYCFYLFFSFSVRGQKTLSLKIGAIFSENNTGLDERVFRFAVRYVSKKRLESNFNLTAVVKFAPEDDLFENIYRANQLISEGVVAIIGPKTSAAVKAIYPVCSKFNIPLISASATDPSLVYKNTEYLLRMSPPDTKMSDALVDLIKEYKWNRMGILTSDTDYGLNSLLDFKESAVRKKWEILGTEHFSVNADKKLVNVSKNLRNLREQGARVIVLSCSAVYVPQVLAEAEKLRMFKDSVWILTDGAIEKENTDIHYKEGLIGVAMPMKGSGDLYNEVVQEWEDMGETKPLNAWAGRIFDAVLTVAKAIETFQDNLTSLPPVKNGLCPLLKRQSWVNGSDFMTAMKNVKIPGIMSTIEFKKSGSPVSSKYDMVNYQRDEPEGWVKVGKYDERSRPPLNMTKKRPIVWPDGTLSIPKLASLELKYRKIKVLIKLNSPFVMKKKNFSESDDGTAYEGFCIDLLNALKGKLQFEYELHLRSEIGERRSDGTWSGMIGELTRKKATLAVSTLTISPEREKAVDFTQPYFNQGFKIVMKKTDMEDKVDTWGFLNPFEKTLWMAIIGSSIIVGIVVWIFDRLSPYGFHGRVVRSENATSEEIHAQNTLSILNSLWAATSSFMEQGPDSLHPGSPSGRATTLAWWFAISIFGATYTANLAAFLTINKYDSPIKSIEDLAYQDKIKYGTADGQLSNMLKTTSLPIYEKLWKHMIMEPNSSFGIDKVRKTENYAFIWDSAVLEYETQREPCNTLKLVERPFGDINYGFALPRKSPYTHKFSVAMLQLQQEGFLERMTEKWFRSRSVCSAETQAAQATAEEGGDQLRFIDMAGVFITLAVGIVAGMVVLLVELIYASYKDTKSKDSMAPKTTREALTTRLHQSMKSYRIWSG
ncbi:glutamate receptor 2-like isoform X1 [Acropora muricata]|uniref:glutamate receptor 2-like isoform X1 n=1 Tax=Acropora muricata TaxID=159855 RepID=UPI0034E4D5F0